MEHMEHKGADWLIGQLEQHGEQRFDAMLRQLPDEALMNVDLVLLNWQLTSLATGGTLIDPHNEGYAAAYRTLYLVGTERQRRFDYVGGIKGILARRRDPNRWPKWREHNRQIAALYRLIVSKLTGQSL